LQTLTADVIKSSDIEGEKLDAEQVRSSIARRLGMNIGALKLADRDVEGVVEMMVDATRHYDQPLTKERLFAWHAALFPTGRSGMRKIRVGAWREDSEEPMQVASGPMGKKASTSWRRQRRASSQRWPHFSNGSTPKMISIKS
jgi:Fic family protein